MNKYEEFSYAIYIFQGITSGKYTRGHDSPAALSTDYFQNVKYPMLNKYEEFRYVICTFQGEGINIFISNYPDILMWGLNCIVSLYGALGIRDSVPLVYDLFVSDFFVVSVFLIFYMPNLWNCPEVLRFGILNTILQNRLNNHLILNKLSDPAFSWSVHHTLS